MTQLELADRAGLSLHAISMLERGTRRAPRSTTVQSLADALQLDGADRTALEAAARASRAGSAGAVGELTVVTARTLPRDVSTFTGRQEELQRLLRFVSRASRAGQVAVVAIDGMPGVGKTAFVVHAAHRLAADFRDGQLFVDLHAHSASRAAVSPMEALSGLLLATGVPAAAIPSDLDTRASMWRDRLAGRQVLIVLDDAASHDQVSALLPGVPGCLVLITSRRRLTDLHDVEIISLGTLSRDTAIRLFVRIAGLQEEPDSQAEVAAVVHMCGYLPLALGLLAGRMRAHPTWTARHLAGSIKASRAGALGEMQVGVAVDSAFELSYQNLPHDQKRLFRHLGLHPGGELDAHAAAALDGGDLGRSRRGLEALHDVHLIDERLPGRYRLHELIRSFARSLVSRNEADDDEAATSRLLDYYLRATVMANRLVVEYRDSVVSLDGTSETPLPDLGSRQAALSWLALERPNLLACVRHAAGQGREEHAVRLAHAVHAFLRTAGDWDQAVGIHQTAGAIASRAGGGPDEGRALTDLADTQILLDAYASAARSATRALSILPPRR